MLKNVINNFFYYNKTIVSKLSRYNSTIFALSSGHGKCGVAVIRLSGSNTEIALKSLTGLTKLPQPRTAILRSIKHPLKKNTLDKGLILWFPGPSSFTGEDCCEFHVHGGVAVINSVFDALSNIPNLRLAEPGEFTRRAFFNGKLDLTEVEGLADLLQAETELQRQQAFLQTQGVLSKLYNKWRNILIKSVAYVEAHIDFEETETLEHNILHNVVKEVNLIIKEIESHLKDGRKGEMLRTGIKTVILGEPNVGKSSLFNLLCKRPAAIVTPIEGTTRDILEVVLNIQGYPLILADTAGLRPETNDTIEREGIRRTLNVGKDADLIILTVDCFKWFKSNHKDNIVNYLKEYIRQLGLEDLLNNGANTIDNIMTKEYIIVFNKSDLMETHSIPKINFLSCATEEGIESFLKNLGGKLKILCGEPNAEHPSMNQARHRQHLTNCLINLNSSIELSNKDTVLMAESLRKSLKSLGYLVGTTTTEDLLNVIFKDFCIGK